MSYKSKERNDAILSIGHGEVNFENIAFYEELESFGWLKISRAKAPDYTLELTYSGKDLFNRLEKLTRENSFRQGDKS